MVLLLNSGLISENCRIVPRPGVSPLMEFEPGFPTRKAGILSKLSESLTGLYYLGLRLPSAATKITFHL